MTERGAIHQERPKEFPLMPVRQVPEDFVPGRTTLQKPSVVAIASAQDTSPRQRGKESQERQTAITVTGTVADKPRFHKSKKTNIDVMEFGLRVKHGDEEAVLAVVFFGERVEKVRAKIVTGKELHVKGYLHVTERKGRDGTVHRDHSIYGVALPSHTDAEESEEQLGLQLQ